MEGWILVYALMKGAAVLIEGPYDYDRCMKEGMKLEAWGKPPGWVCMEVKQLTKTGSMALLNSAIVIDHLERKL